MDSWPAVETPQLSWPEEVDTQPSIQVFDTATQQLQSVGSTNSFSMYVCGITPYDATHMGHAATYVAFDVLNRVNRDAGRRVTYVQNVTDIDDPLLERAQATGVDWQSLAHNQIDLFRQDMAALRVLPPTHYVSAIAEIPAVVTRVQQMQSAHAVYELDGDWYFQRTPALGQVSGLGEDRMLSIFAERGGDPRRPGKRDALDCLVWMAARPDEPHWPSSMGEGRPGWHIECTTIAMDLLDLPIDVQGGGSDLAFPHHDMCNMQARALTGRNLAHAFVHAGMIGLDGEKMSKSKGNLVLVSNLRMTGTNPMAIRLALLAGHYRNDRDWTEELLLAAEARLGKWRQAASVDVSDAIKDIRDALRNDLDTPSALRILDDLCETTAQRDDSPAVTLQSAAESLLGIAL